MTTYKALHTHQDELQYDIESVIYQYFIKKKLKKAMPINNDSQKSFQLASNFVLRQRRLTLPATPALHVGLASANV